MKVFVELLLTNKSGKLSKPKTSAYKSIIFCDQSTDPSMDQTDLFVNIKLPLLRWKPTTNSTSSKKVYKERYLKT